MTDNNPAGDGGFDPDRTRRDVALRFREGALPTGQDFRDLIDSMALDGEFSAFRDEARDALENARDMAELVEQMKLLRFKEPVFAHTRLGNYVHRSNNETGESSNAPVILKSTDTRILIPDTEAPFTAEVVAHLQDPDHRPTGRFETQRSVMLHAVVTCHGKRHASLRLTRSPAVFGPLFRRPFNAASWMTLLPLLALAGLFAAAMLPGFDPWSILANGTAGEGETDIARISLGGLVIAIVAMLTIGCGQTWKKYQRLRLFWKPDTGLVLRSQPFTGPGENTGNATQTVLRCHVTLLSHAD